MAAEDGTAAEYKDGDLEKALQEAETGEGAPAEEAEVPEEAAPELEEPEDDEGVEEHLRDAVEGTLRLKRMLSEDEEAPELAGGKKKKSKIESELSEEMQAKVNQLLTKYGLQLDKVCRHVLEGLDEAEVDMLVTSSFIPDKFNQWKGPGELVHQHVQMLHERAGVGGGTVDLVTTFKHRFKLTPEQEAALRKLSHKDLRYVLKEYDGVTPLEDVIEQAASTEADDFETEGVLPEASGPSTMSRFNRLELIDPIADAAVFGDANLTFALRLTKQRKALGHTGRIVATTFETLDCLRERYKEIDETIKTLEDHYAEVYHGVDCTRIAVDPRFKNMEDSLGAVYYNFPHAGAVSGFFDGHPCVNWRHENLMRLFFRALRSFVKPGGWVKVSSSKGAVGVRYSYIVGSAAENEFTHYETMPLLEWHLHRYGRSYGDKRDVYRRPEQGQGYNVQRAEADMVYTFRYTPTGEVLPPQRIRLPPKFGTLCDCKDGPFKSMVGEAKKNHATTLYKRFVTECSGTHVG
eukprot:TRINITY_DN24988_c2_g1_i1.p1 TRINITY_DN24988_c2_g1~~TRINITY_DN24988_c2_g1_i1.p1  ORF type:complete len:520 (+),score=150.49 TRINITY_DN24988_c2_g1_i1:59-1618(+)